MTTTPAEALDELIRQVAGAPTGTQRRLISCRMCRNHLLYLLDTLPLSDTEGSSIVAARLRALADVHRGHMHHGLPRRDSPDNAIPQIRWVTA